MKLEDFFFMVDLSAAPTIGVLQADPAHVPNPTATEVPSEVRHLCRVNGSDGGQGKA